MRMEADARMEAVLLQLATIEHTLAEALVHIEIGQAATAAATKAATAAATKAAAAVDKLASDSTRYDPNVLLHTT